MGSGWRSCGFTPPFSGECLPICLLWVRGFMRKLKVGPKLWQLTQLGWRFLSVENQGWIAKWKYRKGWWILLNFSCCVMVSYDSWYVYPACYCPLQIFWWQAPCHSASTCQRPLGTQSKVTSSHLHIAAFCFTLHEIIFLDLLEKNKDLSDFPIAVFPAPITRCAFRVGSNKCLLVEDKFRFYST